MKNVFFVVAIIGVLLVSSAVLAQQNQYIIGIPWVKSSGKPVAEIEDFITEAYRRVGQMVKVEYSPSLRELEDADSGIHDASIARSKTAISSYENLIAVNQPLVILTLVAFTAKSGIWATTWEDLHSLKIGIIRGSMTATQLAERNGLKPYLVNDVQLAFSMLLDGKLDAVLHDLHQGLFYTEQIGMTVYASPALHTEPLYHVLNRKHADLAPKLGTVFREMHEDGTSARLLGKWAAMLPELPEQTK